MKIILTIAGLGAEFGGPSRSVPALAMALARLGADVELVTTAARLSGGSSLLPPADLVRSHVLPVASRSNRWLPSGNAFVQTLRARCSEHHDVVIHDQGLWLPSNHAVAFVARELGHPRVVSPRGMLSSWALAAKGLKKKAAWALYQRRDFMRSSAVHVTSDAEADDCRRSGYAGPLAVVCNGTDLPPPCTDATRASAQRNVGRRQRIVLCISRVHPVKGLPSLVQAWSQLRPAEWRLVLCGGGEARHMSELRAQIDSEGLSDSVELVGEVGEDLKWNYYRSADLFVLPSHSENFGIVVAEALAVGVPVITTRGTPWADLVEHRCGWWTEVGAAPIADALRAAMATPTLELRAMGERGRRLVEEKYSWDKAARAMLAFYETVLRRHRSGVVS